MTKILHIPSGEFVVFLSSNEYDEKHQEDRSERVTRWEDSYDLAGQNCTIEDKIKGILVGIDHINHNVINKCSNYCREEFEIIYD